MGGIRHERGWASRACIDGVVACRCPRGLMLMSEPLVSWVRWRGRPGGWTWVDLRCLPRRGTRPANSLLPFICSAGRKARRRRRRRRAGFLTALLMPGCALSLFAFRFGDLCAALGLVFGRMAAAFRDSPGDWVFLRTVSLAGARDASATEPTEHPAAPPLAERVAGAGTRPRPGWQRC